jgi:hypothetical protein
VGTHAEALQVVCPWALVHAFPQPPQLATLKPRLVSQPLAGFPSQSSNPESHEVISHCPVLHAAPAFGRLHAFPQKPQFLASVPRLVSQTVLGSPSHSPVPAGHFEIPHCPELQIGLPPVAGHTLPQLPQLVGSPSVFASQPSLGSLLQSAYPASQLPMPHSPELHAGVAWGVTHALPQPPQLPGSLSSCASHPSLGSALQSL